MFENRPDHGDVTAEYLAARRGRGIVSGFSTVVWGSGADAVSFLDGQLSQDVAGMEAGSVARSMLLEPRGKMVALLWLLRAEGRVGMVTSADGAEILIGELERFKFRVDVDFDLDPRPAIELWGAKSGETARSAGFDWGAGWAESSGSLAALLPATLTRVLLLGAAVDDLESVGAIRVGEIATGTVRIEAGEPVMGVDIDESTIPQESGLVETSVSFTKGCFVGQELVARIDSRGRVNRRLAGLVVGRNVVPPVGAEVSLSGEPVGVLSTVGESLTLRAPVALAMVHRNAETGAEVQIRWQGGSAPAVVRPLPLDDFSDASHSPNTSTRS